jgi:hypothetical protein
MGQLVGAVLVAVALINLMFPSYTPPDDYPKF